MVSQTRFKITKTLEASRMIKTRAILDIKMIRTTSKEDREAAL